MTENQFFDFIHADELTRKTLIEAHQNKRYRIPSMLVYSSNGSGDCMLAPSGEEIFIYHALEWIGKIYDKRFYYLASDNSRRTHLLCSPQDKFGHTEYLEFCSSHPFSYDDYCIGCINATIEPYTFYPEDHMYHGKFLNVKKSKISD
jgi:hypothetical protein